MARDGSVCHGFNMPQCTHASASKSVTINGHQVNAQFLIIRSVSLTIVDTKIDLNRPKYVQSNPLPPTVIGNTTRLDKEF